MLQAFFKFSTAMKWRKTFKLAFNDNVKLIYVQRKDVTRNYYYY